MLNKFKHLQYIKKNTFTNQLSESNLSFVPKHKTATDGDVRKLCEYLARSSNILVVTGAGVSTESGIPDYRSEEVGLYARSSTRPIMYGDFVNDKNVRKRYWTRNFCGWPKFSAVKPNGAHFSLKQLQKIKKVNYIITQNVDNLHSKAENENVIELHGTAFKVKCLSCSFSIERYSLQKVLEVMNPHIHEETLNINPDGDVEVMKDIIDTFNYPDCPKCSGILIPDIVFFGDNVPKDRVELISNKTKLCDAVMVVGSSLTVFSSYRIVLEAHNLKKLIVIINIGSTRGDSLSDVKFNFRCGDILPKAVNLLLEQSFTM